MNELYIALRVDSKGFSVSMDSLYVGLEICLPIETAVAHWAQEVLLLKIVHVHVPAQVAAMEEGTEAYVACRTVALVRSPRLDTSASSVQLHPF